jgi:hypothetical protein
MFATRHWEEQRPSGTADGRGASAVFRGATTDAGSSHGGPSHTREGGGGVRGAVADPTGGGKKRVVSPKRGSASFLVPRI